jgi:DNA-binding XRE family transcriptional regulator
VKHKYAPLHDHLRRSGQDELTMAFRQIERLIDEDLPPSARTQRGWWSNRSRGSPQAAAWMGAAYHVEELDLEGERVTFRKPVRPYRVRREAGAVVWDGELVKALRTYTGWTQADLAQEMGVRQQTVSEWETGAYTPRRSMSKLLTLIAEQAGFRYGD